MKNSFANGSAINELINETTVRRISKRPALRLSSSQPNTSSSSSATLQHGGRFSRAGDVQDHRRCYNASGHRGRCNLTMTPSFLQSSITFTAAHGVYMCQIPTSKRFNHPGHVARRPDALSTPSVISCRRMINPLPPIRWVADPTHHHPP